MRPDTPISLRPVVSGNLRALGYDRETETLAVQFGCGALWHYLKVPRETAERLRTAESVGLFFINHIRMRFEGQPIPDKPETTP